MIKTKTGGYQISTPILSTEERNKTKIKEQVLNAIRETKGEEFTVPQLANKLELNRVSVAGIVNRLIFAGKIEFVSTLKGKPELGKGKTFVYKTIAGAEIVLPKAEVDKQKKEQKAVQSETPIVLEVKKRISF